MGKTGQTIALINDNCQITVKLMCIGCHLFPFNQCWSPRGHVLVLEDPRGQF